jgi:hypothetical protein
MALSNFNGTWTLSQAEYQQLKNDSDLLEALQAVGVDNWGGYSTAWQIVEGEISVEDI